MTIHKALHVGPSGLDLAYERLGDPTHPPVLLIMGIAGQLISWPDGFCAALVERGLQVIRFDNRDVGESTHVTEAYTLSDMAADTVGLLDALGLDAAHVVGVSMGGFIAQTLAIEHPRRVRTLTSMSSTTGDPSVGQTAPEVLRAFGGKPPTTRDEIVQRTLDVLRVIGSPGYPLDLEGAADRAGRAFDRAFDPPGLARQAAAAMSGGDRTAKLRALDVPALVIHGAEDPMWNVSGGLATAAAIPGAELVVIEGMGHDLPPAVWPRIISALCEFFARHVDPPGAGSSTEYADQAPQR